MADCPTSLGSMLGHSLAESGDGILVSRPIYGRFELDYGVESGVKMVYADTTVEEAFSPACVEKYELAFKESSKNIRAVLLVNPHNPVGELYMPLGPLIELIWYGQVVVTQSRHSRLSPDSVISITSISSVMRYTLHACLILVTLRLCHLRQSSRWILRD